MICYICNKGKYRKLKKAWLGQMIYIGKGLWRHANCNPTRRTTNTKGVSYASNG